MEHQITQPALKLTVMETCYEKPEDEETFTTEEETNLNHILDPVTNLSTTRELTSIKEAGPRTKDDSNMDQM